MLRKMAVDVVIAGMEPANRHVSATTLCVPARERKFSWTILRTLLYFH